MLRMRSGCWRPAGGSARSGRSTSSALSWARTTSRPSLPRDRYVELVVEQMIPCVAARGLAEFCDVYCDDGYYTVAESRRILEAGAAAGLRPKIHTDAYSDIGGAVMAAELGAVSADHLNYTTPAAARRLAASRRRRRGHAGARLGRGHTRPFDARMLLAEGMTLALATDLCPGCWAESMQFVMQLACRLYRFSPAEALLAATPAAPAPSASPTAASSRPACWPISRSGPCPRSRT